jgi:hypothetical protein
VALEGWELMSATDNRVRVILFSAGLASGLVTLQSPDLQAQGMYAGIGGGVGVLEWQDGTAVQPALQLSAGYQSAGAATVRLDARMIGTTNSALFGPGLGVGVGGSLGRIPHAYLLGAAGTLLASEGTWTSSFGIVSGAGGAGRTGLFGEVRLEFLTGDLARAQRGSTVASMLAGVRLGPPRTGR